MQGIGERLILLTCCLILAIIQFGTTASIIISVLLIFIVGCCGVYIKNRKTRLFIVSVYMVLTFFFGSLLLFVPIAAYEWYYATSSFFRFKRENQRLSNEEQKNNIICMITACLIVGSMYINANKVNAIQLIGLVVLVVIAIWMGVFCSKYTELKLKFIASRDSSVELTLELRNKNRYLIEKQDSEIYLATLSERNRIAREIHDNVGHMLSRSILQTGAVLTINKDTELKPFLEGIKETLDLAMTSIRTSVHDIHDDSIDIREAIKDITKDMSNYSVSIDYDMHNDVPRNIKYCMISVVKEAISNIIKHSNADKVIISFREHPAFFRLLVEDNGTICKKRNIMQNIDNGNDGIGLCNIRDRVESLKGTLNIDTEKGFRMHISIPK